VIWTLVPLAAVIYLSVIGASTLAATQRADPKPLVVNVIGSQWSWRFDYPDAGLSSNELVLPLNKQVLLRLHSLDVIHSFWVPEFRVKQDLLPGGDSMIRELRITPDLVGNYKVRCSEMCGRLHASMEAPVRVVSQTDYDAWVKEQLASIPADPVGRGQKWARQFGCQACHTTDGTVLVGPSWKGIYGNPVTFTDGTSATVDDAYIRESILQPSAKIVKGFQPLMPSLGSQLTDQQINDIIEYIKSLK
jgi:cytochrome c oxidase subunit 2